jgi:hypothetical protein
MKRLSHILACTALAVIALASCQNSASAPPKSTNAKLSALAVSAGTLTPAFNADTEDYAVTVLNDAASITVTGTAADSGATLSANNGTAQNLSVGTNTISLVVTAQDGVAKKTYTVVVTREPPPKSANAKLSALSVSAGTLTPAFNADTADYAVAVPNAAASITVTGTAADSGAALSANNGTAQTLSVGANTISLVVTAQDGVAKKTYTVVVTRGDPPADLAIKGKWHMIASGNDQDITFANDAITFNAGSNPGLCGDIVSYDNAAKSLVMKWKTHPAYAGKYQKWSWSGSPVNALAIGAEFATEAEAAADATTKYSGAVTKIVFSDDFDRADTTSPDVSNALWKVTYAPNAVAISGNRLRLGTANEQQASIETADKLDLSSDFAISADFTNMRFGFYLRFTNANILYFMPLETGNYYILYPTSSTPAAQTTIAGGIAADTQYRLEVRKVGNVLTSKITKGTSTIFTYAYTLTGTEDFSSVTFGVAGGGKSGFGTGDVYVDHVRIEKL